MKRGRLLLLLALAATLPSVLAGSRAAADWLLLREGERMETRGPWEVRGKLVVFTTVDGRLSSMRLSDVDLEASHRATEAIARQPAKTPASPPERQPQAAVFVLTDADVAHGSGRDSTPAASADGEPAAAASAAARLVVSEWQEATMPDDNGVRLSGTLLNRGGKAATRVQLTALVYDREGSLIATGEARLSTSVLMPDRQARFEVDFPGVFDFAAAKFKPTSLDFETGSPEGAAPESEGQGSAVEPEGPSG